MLQSSEHLGKSAPDVCIGPRRYRSRASCINALICPISLPPISLYSSSLHPAASLQELKEEFKDFTKWWKKAIGEDKVSNVKVSNRLLTTPCVVVAGKYGQSANMERITKAQAFQDPSRASFMKSQRVLEINPR